VFQKRLDGSIDFYLDWNEYKRGFGHVSGEFWLGLDKIHRLTKERSRLRVDLEDFDGETAYAEYDLFAVGDEESKYKLSIGNYSGGYHNNQNFVKINIFKQKAFKYQEAIYDCKTCVLEPF